MVLVPALGQVIVVRVREGATASVRADSPTVAQRTGHAGEAEHVGGAHRLYMCVSAIAVFAVRGMAVHR